MKNVVNSWKCEDYRDRMQFHVFAINFESLNESRMAVLLLKQQLARSNLFRTAFVGSVCLSIDSNTPH